MDSRAVVDPMETPAETIAIEQAIFTSIPSPMGNGYRIVAASPGITTAEKQGIIRRAPSHGSLCDTSEAVAGLASYRLESGRRCLMLSHNAGLEHTARGGQRVHTHVLVLDEALFRRFQCDPLIVETEVRAEVGQDPPCNPPARLDTISLPAESLHSEPAAAYALNVEDLDGLKSLLSAVLNERRLLVLGAPDPRAILRWMLDATPVAVRTRLSMSYGLKFSPARKFQLIFAGPERGEAARLAGDQDIDVLNWDAPHSLVNSNFAGWLSFVRRCWESERADELSHLVTQLTQECSAQELELVATLCMDIDQLAQADPPLVEELIQKHSQTTPTTPIQTRLLDEFRETAETRQSSLVNT